MHLTVEDYDRYLFHFTPSSKALDYILPSMSLKLSPITEMNDPKENKTFGFGDIYTDFEDNFELTKIQNAFEQYLTENCKLACFASDHLLEFNNFVKFGYDHPPMWSHYANKYTGVCLVLDKKKILELLDNESFFIKDIKYSHLIKYPSMSPELYEKNSIQYFKKYITENIDSLFFQKFNDWNYEHETRIFHLGDQNYFSIKGALVGIFIGTEFDKKLIDLLINLTSENDIWIEQIKIKDGRLFPIPLEMILGNNNP